MNLPDLYARVCAVRPELAVPMLKIDTSPPGWSLCGSWCGEHFTAALILARWVEALPARHSLIHHEGNNRACEEWQATWYTLDNRPGCGPCAPTPIEALAAFYLGESE